MTIGPLVPGSPTRVTPDTAVAPYIDIYGPAPDGLVRADDILGAYDAALHVQSLITEGPRRLRVGSTSDMTAFTDAVVGDCYLVQNQGLYIYRSAAPTYGAPWEYAGWQPMHCWRHSLYTLLTPTSLSTASIARVGPYGSLDTVTPNGKIPMAQVQNQVWQTQVIYGSSLINESVGFGVTVNPTNARWDVSSTVAGDVFVGNAGPIWLNNTATSGYSYMYVDFTEAYGTGGATTQTIARQRVLINTPGFVTLPFRHVSAQSGTSRIQLRFVAANTDNAFTVLGGDDSEFKFGTLTIYRP